MIPPRRLVDAVIRAESGGNPRAVSPVGAQGLMQVMPATARDPGFGIAPLKDPFDAEENRRFGTEYLGAMLRRYDGDTEAALAAYNWGPGNADRWVKGGKRRDMLPAETRNYVRRITAELSGGGGDTTLIGGTQAVQPSRDYAADLLGEPNPQQGRASRDWAAEFGLSDRPASAPEQPVPVKVVEEPGMIRQGLNWLTGNVQREDIPELSGANLGGADTSTPIALALALHTDEKAQSDVIRRYLPGAIASQDAQGNAIIEIPDDVAQKIGTDAGRFYLNKPGASVQDALTAAGQIVSYIPAGRAAGMAKGLAARIGIGATGSAATSVAQDAGAMALGSEQGVDAGRAIGAAVGGGAGEVAGEAITRLWRVLPWRQGIVGPNGALNDIGKRAARAAGIDPDTITPRVAAQLDKIARRSGGSFADDAQTATTAINAATAQRFKVPLSRGQMTGNVRQLAKEEAMRNDALGQGAGRIMRSFDDTQEAALQEAASKLQGRLSRSSAPTIGSQAEAGGAVLEGIRSAAGVARRRISDAYDVAGGYDARLTADSVKALQKAIVSGLRADDRVVDQQLTPATRAALSRMRSVLKVPNVEGDNPVVKKVALKKIEVFRRQLSQLQSAAANPADAGNVLAMKRTLDDWLDDAVDAALFEGDETALAALKAARKERSEFGRLFESSPRQADADAGKIIEKMLNRDVTNTEAVDYVLGRSALGGTQASARVLGRIKEIVGEGSPAWNAVREAAFHRAIFGPRAVGNEPLRARQRIVNSLDNALAGRGREIMEQMFSPAEMKEFASFRDLIKKTVLPAEASNPSKTAFALSRLVQDSFDKLAGLAAISTGNIGGMATVGAGGAGRALTQRGAARAATKASPFPQPRSVPIFAATAAGGAEYGETP